MKMILRAVLLLFIALPFSAPRAQAQAADTARITTALWTICPGAVIRVSTSDGKTATGRCQMVTDGRLDVERRGGAERIPLVQVDSVWQRRTYRAEMTLGLAVVGTVAGLLLSGEKQPEDCTPLYGCGDKEEQARDVVWGVGGALAGAAVGLTLGSGVRRWRLLVP